MKMTWEKAITILQREKDCVQQAIQNAVDGDGYVSPDGMIRAEDYVEACVTALSALRLVSREQVERMRGEWVHTHSTDNFWTEVWKCSYCGFEDDNGDCFDFCPECGQPKTGEAVEMVMEKINNMEEMTNEH